MKKYTLELNAKISTSTLKGIFLNEERTNITDQAAVIVNNEESFTAPTMRTLVREKYAPPKYNNKYNTKWKKLQMHRNN